MEYLDWLEKLMQKYKLTVEDINNMSFFGLYTLYDIDKEAFI